MQDSARPHAFDLLLGGSGCEILVATLAAAEVVEILVGARPRALGLVPRENAPLGSVSHESVGNYLVAFLVFPFFFFFCRGVSVISDPKGGSWNFLLRNRGKLVSERRSPKRFLEDGESDIDADVERFGM